MTGDRALPVDADAILLLERRSGAELLWIRSRLAEVIAQLHREAESRLLDASRINLEHPMARLDLAGYLDVRSSHGATSPVRVARERRRDDPA